MSRYLVYTESRKLRTKKEMKNAVVSMLMLMRMPMPMPMQVQMLVRKQKGK